MFIFYSSSFPHCHAESHEKLHMTIYFLINGRENCVLKWTIS